MKGTKLWQAPGSPVIQGRSREQRPFLNVWAFSAAAAALVLLGALFLYGVFPGDGAVPAMSALSTSLTFLTYALPGLAVGSLLGTAFSRAIGTRRAWLGGCLLGVIIGGVAISLLASNLALRGISFS